MQEYVPIPPEIELIATQVVDAAFNVHKNLGPGLLESVYATCLGFELNRRQLQWGSEVALPIIYDGIRIDSGLRMDLLVADKLIVEVKAVDKLIPLYEAQLLTYLKLSKLRLGLLINFNTILFKEGIRRLIV